ncbi:MAG: TlpA disulfide reductase family protein [Cocleimonas sp.]
MKQFTHFISQFFLIGFAFVALSACDKTSTNAAINKVAPEFSLPSVTDDKQIKLSDYKGKLVLLNFWASWCPPCRAEIPGFINIQKEYKDKGFTIIGLAIEDKQASLKYAKDIGINYPIAYGIEKVHDVAGEYGNPDGGLPYTVLIDQKQKILSVYSGFLSEDKLKKMLEKHLPK